MKPIALIAFAFAFWQSAGAQERPLQLPQALAAARANRPNIEAAQLRVTSARLSRRGLGAFPATRLFVGYTSDVAVGGSDDDFVLAQPLDIFGRASAFKAVGDAEIARVEAELQQVLVEVQSQVLQEFSKAAAAKALADSAAQGQEIAQKLYGAIQTLVEEGKLPGVQLARVGIELDRAKLTAGQRNSELQASIQRLSGLLNTPAEGVVVQDFAELTIELIDPALMQRQRADLMLLTAEIRAAEAEARLARLGNAPELEIQGRRTAWQEPEPRYGLRVQLALPIYDFGRARAEAASARTKAEAARKALADAKRIAESELLAARIELSAALEQIQRYQAIVANARLLVERSRIGFTEKAITLVELLESTRALREVEEGYVDARLRLAQAQSAYLRASGKLLEVDK